MHDANILIVDDDSASIQVLIRVLSGLGKLRFATSGEAALRLALEEVPDLVLLDAEMPGMSGFDVCHAMRSNSVLAPVPVIFVTSHGGSDVEVAGLAIGAVDFIGKPVSAPLLRARVKTHLRLKELSDQLRRDAMVDPLTGIANRRSFNAALDREWMRARRIGHPISLLMIDVDFFKLYNDHYGHQIGDKCLVSVARVLAQSTRRPADMAARYGGGEFVVLLPDTAAGGAQWLAQRALSAIEALGIAHAGSPLSGHVTASVGVASFDDTSRFWCEPGVDSKRASDAPAPGAADLIGAADKALSMAKRSGRAQMGFQALEDARAGLAAAPTPEQVDAANQPQEARA